MVVPGDSVRFVGSGVAACLRYVSPFTAYGFEMLIFFAIFLCSELHLLIVFPML